MDAVKLIRMANQIAGFFESMPDRRQAVDETAQHIRKTWDPRMRRALFAHFDQHGAAEMSDLLQEVVVARRGDLEPR
jgi:formate dehydrogenase subunit delta